MGMNGIFIAIAVIGNAAGKWMYLAFQHGKKYMAGAIAYASWTHSDKLGEAFVAVTNMAELLFQNQGVGK